ncbi:DinB family protein [Bacillus sp. UNCCL81]|uniref:DinB family protein n=1 Tax=Bacillus sp. UNCCL81 TaxID=1502755 RepID=UPI0008E862C4|nr:DinB family protein [Bacillus sp. UNCCL81]SFD35522.1 DinB superfamily protein [Bacillus sp. UNCCL81]
MSTLSIEISEFNQLYDLLSQKTFNLSKEKLHWKKNERSWSILEVLTHLVDHAFVVNFRLREVLAGSSVQLPAFNQDKWIAGQYANDGNIADVLETYRVILYYNSQLLKRLTSDDWKKSGINPQNAIVTVEDIIKSFMSHVHLHLKQIQRILYEYSLV